MSTYKTHIYLIRSLTNIHPGSGDNDYGTVDKVVQRDPADNLPVINSTSLKGALREFFKDETEIGEAAIKHIFGEAPNALAAGKTEQRGQYKFFAGNLLSLPVRSTQIPYFNVTGINVIQYLKEMCKEFKIKNDGLTAVEKLLKIETSRPFIFLTGDHILLEGIATSHESKTPEDIEKSRLLLGENIAVADAKQMKAFAEELPIIARNQLENGESKNLWYEEVLPRDTRFFFFLRVPEGDEYFESFETLLTENIIQIGANASVGYGYCKISKFE